MNANSQDYCKSMWRNLLLIMLIHVLCVNLISGEYSRYPNPSKAMINAAANGNSKMLAVGAEGTMIQTLDGTNWEVCISPLDG